MHVGAGFELSKVLKRPETAMRARCVSSALFLAILGQAVAADDLIFSSKGRNSSYASKLSVLDGRAASQYTNSSKLQPQSFEVPDLSEAANLNTKILPYAGSYKGKYLSVARAAAQRHGVPSDLFLRLVQQESGWNANALSHKGAIGLAQLLPGTAQGLGVNPQDPKQNLEGGARYLARMYAKFGTWRLALAAYNAGPGAVQKYGGVPPFKETRNYVKVILGS